MTRASEAQADPAALQAFNLDEARLDRLYGAVQPLIQSAKAALGVALFASENEQVIEQALITPEGEQSRRLTYGGPPKYAPRWAGNLALNWLRQTANKKA